MTLQQLRVLLLALLLFIASTGSGAVAKEQTATFAGGCFWCMEAPFEKLDGVGAVLSGYTGGDLKNPTYAQVSSGSTGHVESIQITYDPEKISYAELLKTYWRQIDPTDSGGQFVDRGFQYTSAIFFHTEEQRKEAQASKSRLNASIRFSTPVVTRIVEATEFYPAEEYHQDFYKKSTIKYKYYRYRSGRDKFLNSIWGKDRKRIEQRGDTSGADQGINRHTVYVKPGATELRARLTPLQYRVTQKGATERAFKNRYWNNKADGIYVDIVSKEPLFSSTDKYVSGTGWPSFTKPIANKSIVEKEERGFFGLRTELRSTLGDSHLGHLFNDGPAPLGDRYCINSASLLFIPVAELEANGLEEYLSIFSKNTTSQHPVLSQ